MSDELQLVSFTLGTEEFGVPISLVQEIVRMPEITKVPRAPGFVEGVVNLRGKIIPVLDLRKRLSLPVSAPTKSTRIIVTTLAGRTVGMIVDAVSEVLRLDSASVEPAPDLVTTEIDSSFLKGIAKREAKLLMLLELERVFDAQEAQALAAIA